MLIVIVYLCHTVPVMLALCPVLCALHGPVWSFLTFVSSILSAEAAAGSRRQQNSCSCTWTFRNNPPHPVLKCSAARHHFTAFTTWEAWEVRAERDRQSPARNPEQYHCLGGKPSGKPEGRGYNEVLMGIYHFQLIRTAVKPWEDKAGPFLCTFPSNQRIANDSWQQF